MDAETARRTARIAGLATLPLGVALMAAPSQVCRSLRLRDHSPALRCLGALDLALVPGLLAGRRPERWLAARAGLNVAIGGFFLRVARQEDALAAKTAVAAMAVATAADIRAITAVRRDRQGPTR